MTKDNLVRMAAHFKALPGQIEALRFIESRLSQNTIKEALTLYRSNPNSIQATSRTERQQTDAVLAAVLRRLKELNIKLEKPDTGFKSYIIGLEGCDIDFSVNDDAPDLWNDASFAIFIDKDGQLTRSKLLRSTTEPGRYYVQNRLNRNGAAFLAIDRIHKDIWMRGSHKNQPNCLIQIGAPVTVYRDNNNSHGRSKSDPVETGWFGRV